jgi:O-6-methylguanine DNA methyltransferase
VPYGEVRTYGWLAEKIGEPRAARGVGSALRGNPIPLVVPCHRIVAEGGGLGGFRAGLDWKRALLELEGVRLTMRGQTPVAPPSKEVTERMSSSKNEMEQRRKSNRLKGYQYDKGGYYFVTICVRNKVNCFGEIGDGSAILNELGEIAQSIWMQIPNHYKHVHIDQFVVMPNHIHGILIIDDDVGTEQCSVPTRGNLWIAVEGCQIV